MAEQAFINGFEIDVFKAETHAFTSDVTEHPVEDGADVADHIRPRPPTVTLECLVSDTPFGDLADRRNADTTIRDFLPSLDAYQRMLEIREARQPVTLETSLGTYLNMALQTLTIPRSAETGDALKFSATFKQVDVVETEVTTVRVAVPRGKKKVNLGNKAAEDTSGATTAPPPPERNLSTLADLAGF